MHESMLLICHTDTDISMVCNNWKYVYQQDRILVIQQIWNDYISFSTFPR